MRKIYVLPALFAFALAAVFALAHHGPDNVVIDAAAAKQKPVPFPHAAHSQTIACDTCHHTQKGLTTDQGAKVTPCQECHLQPQGQLGTMADMSLTKNPMHVQCIGCHKQDEKAKAANAPTKCAGCHRAAA